jgi:hypothetical protein
MWVCLVLLNSHLILQEDEEKEMLERELTIGLLKNRLGK